MGQSQSTEQQEAPGRRRGLAARLAARAAAKRLPVQDQPAKSSEAEVEATPSPFRPPGAAAGASASGATIRPLPPPGEAAAPGAPFEPHRAGPPLPGCEAARAAHMETLDLLDSPPSPELDNILTIVCGLFGTKSALIALFGDKRIWVKNGKNFRTGDFPWRMSFCAWTLASETPQPLVVNDARADARRAAWAAHGAAWGRMAFADHPIVKSGHIAFYAGPPLIASNGHRIGTLCCADPNPQSFDEHQCHIMSNFAAIVVNELERGAKLAARAKRAPPPGAVPGPGARAGAGELSLESSVSAAPGRMLCVACVPGREPSVTHASAAAGALEGVPGLDLVGRPLWSLFSPAPPGAPPEAAAGARRAAQQRAALGRAFAVRGARLVARPEEAYDLTFKPVGAAGALAVPAFVPERPAGAAPDCTYFVTAERAAPGPAAAAPPPPRAAAAPRWGGGAFGGAFGGARVGAAAPPARLLLSVSSDAGGGFGAGGARGCSVHTVVEGRGAQCPLAGLEIGAVLANGSYGRVFRGHYFGALVAVKVLEAAAVTHRDPHTGACYEAVLSKSLAHPNIVATLAWAVVRGEAQVPRPEGGQSLVGESLEMAWSPGAGSYASAAAAAAPAAAPPPPAPPPPAVGWAVSHDAEESEEGQTWIVQEFCDKGCLQDTVDRGWLRTDRSHASGEPNLIAVLTTAHEIALGARYLHSLDVIHGDLSPFNVLLASTGAGDGGAARGFSAKLSDFGLSRSMDHHSKIQTATYGTITHMAPEVLEHGMVSKAADVYSFGVLLWQMCAGNRPWAGMSHAAVVRAVCVERRSLEFPAGAPEGLVMLAAACMARDPSDRPTFGDVIDVLEPLGAALEWPSPLPAAGSWGGAAE
ncbi:MAG: kinase-like domain-containing protein [Monoraphidium minutum]|nr:MAG: kinase-like domain-containing protein [Monoraphidium minutum]